MTQENNKEMPRLIRLREVNSTNAYIQSLSISCHSNKHHSAISL